MEYIPIQVLGDVGIHFEFSKDLGVIDGGVGTNIYKYLADYEPRGFNRYFGFHLNWLTQKKLNIYSGIRFRNHVKISTAPSRRKYSRQGIEIPIQSYYRISTNLKIGLGLGLYSDYYASFGGFAQSGYKINEDIRGEIRVNLLYDINSKSKK